ncbi:MAG: VOC family protein [Verrucomicrobiota bacterium]
MPLSLAPLRLALIALLPALLIAEAPRQKTGQKFLPEGQFVWHEVVSADPDASARFYASVFDWKVVRAPVASPDERPYAMLSHGGQLFAGFAPGEGDARWTSWVQVPDADLVGDQALAAGGLVVRPAREHLIGRVIEIADPGQARLHLVQLHIRQPHVALPPIRWHVGETPARDHTDAFYENVTGWTIKRAAPGAPTARVVAGGHAIAGIRSPDSDTNVGWLPCIEVSDLRRSVARAVAAGGRQILAPDERAGLGECARVADPQGAEFWLVEQ